MMGVEEGDGGGVVKWDFKHEHGRGYGVVSERVASPVYIANE